MSLNRLRNMGRRNHPSRAWGFRHCRLAELTGLGNCIIARALTPPAPGPPTFSIVKFKVMPADFVCAAQGVCVEGGRPYLGVGRSPHAVPVGICNKEAWSNITVSGH